MNNEINQLHDKTAQQILSHLPDVRPTMAATPVALTPDQQQALAKHFNVTLAATPTSEGDLARQALLLLAEDPQKRQAIQSMAKQKDLALQRYDGGTTFVIGAAVVFILQTYIHFERDKDGNWSVIVQKKPTDQSLLKSLVQKLLSFTAGK